MNRPAQNYRKIFENPKSIVAAALAILSVPPTRPSGAGSKSQMNALAYNHFSDTELDLMKKGEYDGAIVGKCTKLVNATIAAAETVCGIRGVDYGSSKVGKNPGAFLMLEGIAEGKNSSPFGFNEHVGAVAAFQASMRGIIPDVDPKSIVMNYGNNIPLETRLQAAVMRFGVMTSASKLFDENEGIVDRKEFNTAAEALRTAAIGLVGFYQEPQYAQYLKS